MSKKDYVKDNVIDLQGKEYLQVAHRVVMFRKEHPNWCIVTEVREVAGDFYVFAGVSNQDGDPISTAHKRIRKNGRGPAAQWPLETAETGAIGRALALCGYGTLAGDLDEGDELADSPVEPEPPKTRKKRASSTGTGPKKTIVAKFDAVKNQADFDVVYRAAIEYLDTVKEGSAEHKAIVQAGTRARNRIAK